MVIEIHIVGHKNFVARVIQNLFGHLVKLRRIGHHLVGNTGKVGDELGNITPGVDQG